MIAFSRPGTRRPNRKPGDPPYKRRRPPRAMFEHEREAKRIEEVQRFVRECCRVDPSLFYPAAELWAEYRAWWKRRGDPAFLPFPKIKFLKRLLSSVPGTERHTDGVTRMVAGLQPAAQRDTGQVFLND